MDPLQDDSELREVEASLRRIKWSAFGGYLCCALWYAIRLEWRGLLGLTCSALVVMIHFLWLEHIVARTIQPGPHVKPWRLLAGTLARFTLFGLALFVVILVARFDVLSVLLGFSIIVIGIMVEAAYSIRKSF